MNHFLTTDSFNKIVMWGYGYLRGCTQCYIHTEENLYPIIDRLYLSNCATAANLQLLQENGITHVISAVLGMKPMYPGHFDYKCVNLRDIPSEALEEEIPMVVDHMEEVLKNPENKLLVHCIAGRSRSVALIIAFLMLKRGYTFDNALSLIQSKNEDACPNQGFTLVLNALQTECHDD